MGGQRIQLGQNQHQEGKKLIGSKVLEIRSPELLRFWSIGSARQRIGPKCLPSQSSGYFSDNAACAAASRAIGTRKGLQLT